jgi:Cof subfamily protein (haloacid dehalogenase superfamily)
VSSRMLIAIDVDGTLVDESLVISSLDRAAIAATVAAGNIVCLASGRLFAAARPLAAQLNLTGPIIALQGAVAYELKNGRRLFCTPLETSLALRAYDKMRASGFHLQLYYGDSLYLDELNDKANYYLRLSRVEPVMVPDLRALLTGAAPKEPGPIKVLGIASAELVKATISVLARALGERVNVFFSLPVFLEVTDVRANKGEALRRIAQFEGIDMSATAAIGDSDNDIPMFEAARVSFAVGNATEAAKRAASEIVSPLGTGVAEALGRLTKQAAREPA